jgi:hypothetical protein
LNSQRAIDDLKRWERKVKNRGEYAPFVSEEIPSSIISSVDQQLWLQEVRSEFDDETILMDYPDHDFSDQTSD